ncbi:hbd, partial [Symbiodinium necroappetens]
MSATDISTIGVIGSGQMGGGIAQVAATAGIGAIAFDTSEGQLEKCKKLHEKLMARAVEKERMTQDEADAALKRITYTTRMSDLDSVDWIVEAAVENAEIKKKIFAQLAEMHADDDVVLATNTSSISITEIATACGDAADRVVGMHFFNPVPIMKLVEVISGLQTSDEVVQRTVALSERMGKTPLIANDRAGFVSNRAFYAWMEGVAEPEAIDGIMKLGCNFPMGPLRLADFIGLDTCVHIMDVLADGLNNDRYRACPLLKQLVTRQRRIAKRLKWTAIAVACAFALLALWHTGYRLTAPSRAVGVDSTGVPPSNARSDSLTVLAYNIAHGRGLARSNWDGGSATERRQRLDAIASVLREAGADVVVLNEVDFDAPWSGGVDQALVLARAAGYPHVARQRNVDVSLPFFGVKFGNAVLSRFPIRGARLIDLPAYRPAEAFAFGKKQGLLVDLELPNGKPIRAFAVHLDARDEATRVESALRLIAACQESEAPLIAAGDFNAHAPGSAGAPVDATGRNTIKTLVESGRLTPALLGPAESAGFTFPSSTPTRTLDWVFATSHFRATDFRVIDSPLSDHLPVLA